MAGGPQGPAPQAGALMGVPLQDPPVRGALEEGQAQAGGRPEVGRARGLQRPRRGGKQQDQGGDQAGIRVQEHRQPDSARHAQVLGPQAGAAGQAGSVTPTHTNSRSLVFLLTGLIVKDGQGCLRAKLHAPCGSQSEDVLL